MTKRALVQRNVVIKGVPENAVQGNTRDLVRTLNGNPFLVGRLVRVDFDALVPKVVAHGLGVRASAFLVCAPSGTVKTRTPLGMVSRGVANGTWSNNNTANATTAAIYKLKNQRSIVGVRFINTKALARTIRCSLWDSSGARLRYKDIAVSAVGVVECFFDLPYDGYALATNFTVSVWEATWFMWNTDTAWTALAPIELGEDLTLVHPSMFTNTGDAFPGTVWTGVHTQVEPILSAALDLQESPDQTQLDPKQQTRLICPATCTADVWFYSRKAAA